MIQRAVARDPAPVTSQVDSKRSKADAKNLMGIATASGWSGGSGWIPMRSMGSMLDNAELVGRMVRSFYYASDYFGLTRQFFCRRRSRNWYSFSLCCSTKRQTALFQQISRRLRAKKASLAVVRLMPSLNG